jgi:hypothetical protein
MAEYYDVVLGAIPLSLIGVSALLSVVGLSWTAAVPMGAVVSVGLIGHAMFVNGPVDAAIGPSGGVTTNAEFEAEGGDTEDVESNGTETPVRSSPATPK